MDIEDILYDFIEVCRLANVPNFNRSSIEIKEGHLSISLEKDTIAAYIFMYGDKCLKVGKVGPNSNARYIYQHYHHKSSNSNLAKSLLNDSILRTSENFKELNVKEWIKANTERINLILDERFGIFVLGLLESFLHCRLHPKYEGFKNQKRTPENIIEE